MVINIFLTCYAETVEKTDKLIHIDSKDYGDTNCFTNMKITEIERKDNISILRFSCVKMGSSVGTSMFIARGFYEVAKSRGAEYFINLKEWDDKKGGRIFIAGFTNTKDVDLKKEFGDEYSYNNEFRQKRIWLSVSQFKMIFELKNNKPK